MNNMIAQKLEGAEFIVVNTYAQALSMSKTPQLVQLGLRVTQGLGAGSHAEIGQAAAEETIDEVMKHLAGSHMCFVTAGMRGAQEPGLLPPGGHTDGRSGYLAIRILGYASGTCSGSPGNVGIND